MKNLTSRKRDLVIGLILLVVLALGFYWYKNRKPQLKVPETPTIQEVEGNLENKFKYNIPDNVEKADLKDITGGDASGIATRNEILVDILDPEPGTFYQAWLENSEGKLVSLGKLVLNKGGWLITYKSSMYPGYNKVVISQEKVFNKNIEERVLTGSF